MILLACVLMVGCAGWTINGVAAERFKHLDGAEMGQLAIGAGSAFIAHWLGHVVFAEASGLDWEQDGMREIIYDASKEELRWMGRAGFLAQLAVGAAVKVFSDPQSMLATGYHMGTAGQIFLYPVCSRGDLELLNESELEWAVYSIAAFYLMLSDPADQFFREATQ